MVLKGFQDHIKHRPEASTRVESLWKSHWDSNDVDQNFIEELDHIYETPESKSSALMIRFVSFPKPVHNVPVFALKAMLLLKKKGIQPLCHYQ